MNILDIIKTRRTIRYFKQDPISKDILINLVEAARCAPSGGNHQPLEYVIVNNPDQVTKIFPNLAWAGYVKPKRNPSPQQQPVSYIVVLANNEVIAAKDGAVDAAASIENILLAAWSLGVGSCWLGTVNRDKVREILEIPANYRIDSVIALGYPDEQPVMEDAGESVRYYLDDNDVLHVPKRPMSAITHLNKFGTKLSG